MDCFSLLIFKLFLKLRAVRDAGSLICVSVDFQVFSKRSGKQNLLLECLGKFCFVLENM